MARRRSRSRPRGKGGLRAKVFGKGLFGRRSERGFFGVDAALIIAYLTILLTAIGAAIVMGLPWVINSVGKDIGLAPLLIHVPGIAGQPLFDETVTSGLVPAGQPTGFFRVSTVMGQLYGDIQLIAFVGLIIVAIVLGITYVSEQFNLVSRGTSFQFFSESALILVLLFIFPIIFNASAAAVNALNQQVILKGDPPSMINEIVDGATSFGLKGFSLSNLEQSFASLLLVTMQATVSFGAIFTAAMAGVGRLLIIGVLAGAFPLILVFRLIPQLRNIAVTLQGALIGLMVGTILVSLTVRISYGIIHTGELSPMANWAFGSGTLAILAVMVFVVAQGFGSVSRMMQGAVVGPASAVVGGTIAAGGGMAVGMTMGGIGAAAGIRGAGLTRMQAFKAIAAGQRAGLRIGRAGPLAALIHGPSTGRETAHEFGAEELGKEMAKTGTPIDDKLAEYWRGPKYQNWRHNLSPTEEKQWTAFGDHVLKKVNSGSMPIESHRRAAGVLYGKSAHLFKHAEKQGNLHPRDYPAGVKNFFNTVKKTDFISTPEGNIPAGEKEAKILIGHVYAQGAGKLPRLGEDV